MRKSICTSNKITKFRKVCTEKQNRTGASALVHATYIRVCRRAGALPSPVLFLVRSIPSPFCTSFRPPHFPSMAQQYDAGGEDREDMFA